jgi:hypothetical protein
VVRLEAMEQRLAAMFQAVQTVEPVLEKFYGSLSRRAEGTLQSVAAAPSIAEQQLSWTERRDAQIEYRWGGGDVDKISIWSAPLEADRITRRF